MKAVQKQNKVCHIDVDADGIQRINESSLNPFYAFIAPLSTEALEFRCILRSTTDDKKEGINKNSNDVVATEDDMEARKYDEVNANNIFMNSDLATTYPVLLRQFKKWYPELVMETEIRGVS